MSTKDAPFQAYLLTYLELRNSFIHVGLLIDSHNSDLHIFEQKKRMTQAYAEARLRRTLYCELPHVKDRVLLFCAEARLRRTLYCESGFRHNTTRFSSLSGE